MFLISISVVNLDVLKETSLLLSWERDIKGKPRHPAVFVRLISLNPYAILVYPRATKANRPF